MRTVKCGSTEFLCGKSYNMLMTWDKEKCHTVLTIYLKTCFNVSYKKQATDMVKIFM